MKRKLDRSEGNILLRKQGVMSSITRDSVDSGFRTEEEEEISCPHSRDKTVAPQDGEGLGRDGELQISDEEDLSEKNTDKQITNGSGFSAPRLAACLIDEPGISESLSSHADRSMASSFSDEFTQTEAEITKGDERIFPERVERVSCPPQPPPIFPDIGPPRSAVILLKWPLSNGRFLRAIDDYDKPIIIVDLYRRNFKHQYCFTIDTVIASDEHGNHCLVCFRYDFDQKSFYLVPKSTHTGTCSETIPFTFVEATRKYVVLDKLSYKNCNFWYTFKTNPFSILESLAYPRYFLSLEKGRKVLLRRVSGEQPETRNFRIQIFPSPQMKYNINSTNYSMFDRLSSIIHVLSCVK